MALFKPIKAEWHRAHSHLSETSDTAQHQFASGKMNKDQFQ